MRKPLTRSGANGAQTKYGSAGRFLHIGQIWPEVGQVGGKFGRGWPGLTIFGRIRAKLSPNSAEPEQHSQKETPNSGHIWPADGWEACWPHDPVGAFPNRDMKARSDPQASPTNSKRHARHSSRTHSLMLPGGDAEHHYVYMKRCVSILILILSFFVNSLLISLTTKSSHDYA